MTTMAIYMLYTKHSLKMVVKTTEYMPLIKPKKYPPENWFWTLRLLDAGFYPLLYYTGVAEPLYGFYTLRKQGGSATPTMS